MDLASQIEENAVLQKEEIQALSVIYGNDYKIEADDNGAFKITLTDLERRKLIQLDVTLSPEYPLLGPPVYALSAPWLSRRQKYELSSELENIYSEHCGESVLFMWTEKIREFLESVAEDSVQSVLPEKKSGMKIPSQSATDPSSVNEEIPIQHGEPITDRRSTFQAHLASVKSIEEVKGVMKKLLENKKIASATHNIQAYRIYIEHKCSFLQDCDDDGEAHAGSRLLHLLQILNARNVVVVVSRWYGGIQLGPDRFKHINNAARSLLKEMGYICEQKGDAESMGSSKSKKKCK